MDKRVLLWAILPIASLLTTLAFYDGQPVFYFIGLFIIVVIMLELWLIEKIDKHKQTLDDARDEK